MYSVAVREHIMVAHSFTGEAFGPAQNVHGATFVVTAEFRCPELNADGMVIDIAEAHDQLKGVLGPINYQNLDDLDEFRGVNTTTEFLCNWIHGRLAEAIAGKFSGFLRIVLTESHVAWGSFEGPVA